MKAHILLWIFFIPFCLISFSANIFAVNGFCLQHERSILLHLKNNLIFNQTKSRKLVSWNQSEDCCQWHGVSCNEGHVIALDLSEESISGGFADSSALFNLHYLQSLNLAFNNLHSMIPRELHKLKNLRYLNLSMAGFEGQIPHEISHLIRLVTLDLSSSFTFRHRLKLEEPNISMLVQNLTNITELYLDGVAISTKGNEWCHVLSSLQNLHVLSMSSCNLSGPIDSSLAKLQSLSVLKLSNNNMSSIVPESFANFSNLATLQLTSCGLFGSFPKDIFKIETLKVLDISDNQYLGGSLPNFPSHSSLQNLNLSYTNFSGELPDAISNLIQLSTLDLSYCEFNGTLPSSISELTQLVYLDLSSNNFTGPLPSFNRSKNLTYLSLFHNHLSGLLPSSKFKGLINLVSIDLGFNSFTGNLPSSLLELPYLQKLKLPHNQLSGILGEFVNTSSSMLEMVDLAGNNLQGLIPTSLFELKKLRVIQLSYNRFNGTIQLEIFRGLRNLTTINLSNNKLLIDVNSSDAHELSPFHKIGNLLLASCKLRRFPSYLRNQSTLLHLDLSSNEIEGPIPYWIWQLGSLNNLNLSNNFLTKFEGNFKNYSSNLFMVDFHSNKLQGPIPFIPKFGNYMDYSSNRFSSIIPPDIGNHLPFTGFLSLANNSFHGQIHESFCNASSLLMLDLSHNNFVGTIPGCFAKLSSTLRGMNFGGNKLQGYIPNNLPTSCDLRLLDLNDNLLEGKIPRSLVNCQKLQVLKLGNNKIIDQFPCFLGNISTLRIMDLKTNKLHGSIGCPSSTNGWQMLHIAVLASNNFSGTIPGELLNSWKAMMRDADEFGNLFVNIFDRYDPRNFKELLSNLNKDIAKRLAKLLENIPPSILDQGSSESSAIDIFRYTDSIIIVNKGLQIELVKILNAFTYVDMSSNNFEGPIPNELMQFKALNALNLSHNALSGPIPSSIGILKNLESLDLSNNSLNGEIPLELASISFLSYLNLSFNHLKGEIPKGTQIQSFDSYSFEGNEELCGPPLTHSCIDDGAKGLSPPTSKTPNNSIHLNFLSVELGFIFGFGIFILPLLFCKRWRLQYSRYTNEMLYKIIPQLDFAYEHSGGKTYKSLRWRF